MEHRIYLINPNENIPTCLIELHLGGYVWKDHIIDKITDLTDDEFMDIAEEQGHVYTLKGFERAFNNEDISDQWYIRIINK